MHRIQILLEPELHRRGKALASREGKSLGEIVRRALAEHLAQRTAESELEALLADPFVDPTPDPRLAEDADHHLYGAPRRSVARGSLRSADARRPGKRK